MTALAVDVALKATVVLVLALLVDLGLRRRSAADRHLVWTLATGAVLLLPLLSASVPAVRWPAVPAAWAGSGGGAAASPGPPAGPDAPAGVGLEVEETVVVADGAAGPTVAASSGAAGDPSGGPPEAATLPGPLPGGRGSGERADGGTAGTAPGTPPSARPWLTLAWAAGAGGLLLQLLLQAVRRVRVRRRAEPFGEGRVSIAAARMAGELGLRRVPELLRGPAGAMPSTWGLLRHRLLLPAGAASWPAERLRAVLAHEMAHVRRRDGWAQLLAVAACTVYWFHPLAWMAARRMASERELACDDEVLRLGARPSGYARALVEVAREIRTRPLAGALATSMARRAGLERRVDSVLSTGRSRDGLSARRASLFGTVGALVVLPIASLQTVVGPDTAEPVAEPRPADAVTFRHPGQLIPRPDQEADACWAPDVAHSMNVHRWNDEHRLRWESAGCVSEILVLGTPAFDADFDAVVALDDGELVRIEERSGGERRSVEMRPAAAGVELTFRRDGRRQEPDAAARSWIAARVVTLLRQTGLAAGERVDWILSREGPDGVLQEVERMSSDRAQALYLGELLDRTELDDGALAGLLATAGRRIGSDGRLAGLLERVAAAEPARVAGRHREAFREAAGTIGSDGDLRRALTRLVREADGDPDVTALALEAADGIGSDGDMSSFLVAVSRTAGGALADPELRALYLEALGTVGSDGDERRARLALARATGGRR